MNQNKEQSSKNQQSTSGSTNSNNSKYTVQKRGITRKSNRSNDIYIGHKSNFKGQLEKCKKLLDTNWNEIFLHGLEQGIPRAMNLAIQLKEFYQGTIDFTSNTSTVKLTDDLIPLDNQTPPSYQIRTVSSIDIRIFRTVMIPN